MNNGFQPEGHGKARYSDLPEGNGLGRNRSHALRLFWPGLDMEVGVGTSWGTMSAPEDPLTNSQIAELLAIAGDDAKPALNRAYRRASRKALLWEEEAACLYHEGRSLTELPGVRPYLQKIIRGWIEVPPIVAFPPAIRENFDAVGRAAICGFSISIVGKNGQF